MYEVLVSREAEKYYKKQGADTKRRLSKLFDALETEPFNGPHIKKLHGELEGKLRYELGWLRVIYRADRKGRKVEIISIRGRGDIYKR